MFNFLNRLIGILLLCAVVTDQEITTVVLTTGTTTNPPQTTPSTITTEAPTTTITSTTTTEAPTTSITTKTTSCTFPEDLVGEWLSTFWGQASITNTTITLGSFEGDRTLKSFDCLDSKSDTYILSGISDFFNDVEFVYHTCMKIFQMNKDHFEVVFKTKRNKDAFYEPVYATKSNATVISEENDPFALFCTEETGIKGELLRKGRELEGALGCPEALRGTFNMTILTPDTDIGCPDGAIITSCDQPKSLVFNYTGCSNLTNPTSYSDMWTPMCVHQNNGRVLLYSHDPAHTFPFSCMEIDRKAGSDVMEVAMSNIGCFDAWQLHGMDELPLILSLQNLDDCDMASLPGNSSNGTSTGGKDAASSMTSNGLLVIAIAAILVVLLTDQFQP